MYKFAGAHRSGAEEDNTSTTFHLKPSMVLPFSFPASSSVDKKDDNVSYVISVCFFMCRKSTLIKTLHNVRNKICISY